MIYYILLGMLVCILWGLVVFVPSYLHEVSEFAIVIGRFGVYGLVSIALYIFSGNFKVRFGVGRWVAAFIMGFIGHTGYYLFLVMGIRYAGFAIPTLIVGAVPVTLMIFGNIVERHVAFFKLLLPVIMIMGGIIGLNLVESEGYIITNGENWLTVIHGSFLATVALAVWTIYAIYNAEYLKQNRDISNGQWTQLIGICGFFQAILLGLLGSFIEGPQLFAFTSNSETLIKFIIVSIILGVVVSWLATSWWNLVSRNLPMVIAGQLIVFETIFGLIYNYIYLQELPPTAEVICALLVIVGVSVGLRVSTRPDIPLKIAE